MHTKKWPLAILDKNRLVWEHFNDCCADLLNDRWWWDITIKKMGGGTGGGERGGGTKTYFGAVYF